MRDVSIEDMAVFDIAVCFARREQPGIFLEIVDRTLAWQIASAHGVALQCLCGSCLMLALATIGAWWLALPCLPLSLAGARFARLEGRMRRPWSAPVIAEFGKPFLPDPQPTGAAP